MCPYGVPGDGLYVRETHYRYGKWLKNGKTKTGEQAWKFEPLSREVHYATDEAPEGVKSNRYRKEAWYKRPSIFLPKEYSRITLEVTGVRVERVQEITTEGIIAEGLSTRFREHDAVVELLRKFTHLWDSINAKRGPFAWSENPWVWVVEFKRSDSAQVGADSTDDDARADSKDSSE